MSMDYQAPTLQVLGTVAELTADSTKMGVFHDGMSFNVHFSCESGNSSTCASNH